MKYQNLQANTGWTGSNPKLGMGMKAVIIEGVTSVACIFCRFVTCIEFDLDLHLYCNHKMDLVRLPIGKGSLNFRIKYAIDEGRRIGQALNLLDEESKQRLGFFVSK